MIHDESEDRRLHELLEPYYAPLRVPVAGQREAVLSSLSQVHAAAGNEAPGRWKIPAVRWGIAASIGVAIVAALLWRAAGDGPVYGFDVVGRRFFEVHTLAIRGRQLVYDHSRPGSPPTAVKVEYVVERPNRFRTTWVGVSQGAAGVEIRTGLRLCDGSVERITDDSRKRCVATSINPLDTRLKTETMVQGLVMLAVLGPPDAAYRHVGQAAIDRRPCDMYETRFGADGSIVATAWIERSSGNLLRVVHDLVQSDGTSRRLLELDDIALDGPLSDDLFNAADLPDYARSAPLTLGRPAAFELTGTNSASNNGEVLEVWQALRVSDTAALLVWRRTMPPAQGPPSDDEAGLSSGRLKLVTSEGTTTLRHAWLHRAGSAGQWNWSLVAAAGGRWPDRSAVRLESRGLHGQMVLEVPALQFADRDVLRQVIAEASRAALPENQSCSLESVLRRADELISRKN